MKIEGIDFIFDRSKSQILQRGIIDPYDLSPEPDEWVVLRPYIFWSHRIQEPIVIPKWFITDLASIPKPCRWLISVNERHRLASLPHDLLYTTHWVSRRKSDLILSDFCAVQGVSYWKRPLIYSAVRVGGWAAWNNIPRSVYAPSSHQMWYRRQYPGLEL